LVLIGLTENNIFCVFISLIGVILGACYSIWLYNRLCFGTLNIFHKNYYADLSRKECAVLVPLIVLTIVLGFYPNIILDTYLANIYLLLEYRQ
jgi:NADH-quinone oxidoreductase subunit M